MNKALREIRNLSENYSNIDDFAANIITKYLEWQVMPASHYEALLAKHLISAQIGIKMNPMNQFFVDKDVMDWVIKPFQLINYTPIENVSALGLYVTKWDNDKNVLLCDFDSAVIFGVFVPNFIPCGMYAYNRDSIVLKEVTELPEETYNTFLTDSMHKLGLHSVKHVHVLHPNLRKVSLEFRGNHLVTSQPNSDRWFPMRLLQQALSIQERKIAAQQYKMKWFVNSQLDCILMKYSRGFSFISSRFE